MCKKLYSILYGVSTPTQKKLGKACAFQTWCGNRSHVLISSIIFYHDNNDFCQLLIFRKNNSAKFGIYWIDVR